jgi:3-methyl-2-oxobutanoate hydroxymethyltransferase
MGVTNDTLKKYTAENNIPVFGHAGCLSGWQVVWYGGYRRVGKTAEDSVKALENLTRMSRIGLIPRSGMAGAWTKKNLTNSLMS